ncbi:MAG: MlaA family lipoprotein [Gammaproteobacteria bacterium]
MTISSGGFCSGRIQGVFFAIAFIASLTLAGCASTGGEKEAEEAKVDIEKKTAANAIDPYENINRKIFTFNDKVDNYVAEPISDAYKWVTPQFVQTGVSNFFNNLKNVNVVLNDLLQAKFQQSAQDSGRFAINTTVGLAGLFDVAKHVGWEQNDEDFEQTLAVWGVPQGSYLVLPLLGPSTARGIPGTLFDTAANPVTYVGLPVQLVSMLNSRANAEGALKFIDEAALDPYVFTRESFLQWRNNLINDGNVEISSDLSEFEDELDEEANNAESESKELVGRDTKEKETVPSPLLPTEKVEAPQAEKTDYKQLTSVSTSFGRPAQSFEEASKAFEEASNELDRLLPQKN